MKTLQEALEMVNRAGRDEFGEEYIPYDLGIQYVHVTLEEFIDWLKERDLENSGLTEKEFMEEEGINDLIAFQGGIAHAATENGKWLDLISLNDLIEFAPKIFYIAAQDECDNPFFIVSKTGPDDEGGYYSTIYEVKK